MMRVVAEWLWLDIPFTSIPIIVLLLFGFAAYFAYSDRDYYKIVLANKTGIQVAVYWLIRIIFMVLLGYLVQFNWISQIQT